MALNCQISRLTISDILNTKAWRSGKWTYLDMNIFAHFLLIHSHISFILQGALLQKCTQHLHFRSTHYQKALGLVPTGDLLPNKDNEIRVWGAVVAADTSEKEVFRFMCCHCEIVEMLRYIWSVTRIWTVNKRFPVDTKSYFVGKTCVGKLGGTEIRWSQLHYTTHYMTD